MDNKNNIPQIYDSTYETTMYNNEEMNDVYSTRYDNRRYDMYDYNRRYDNYYDYDRRYDRDPYRRNRYYQYPYCDRYGRCENPIWWMFWPLFFL